MILTESFYQMDQVILLHEGKVMASGDPAEVLTPANVGACYSVDMHLLEGRFGPVPEFNLVN